MLTVAVCTGIAVKLGVAVGTEGGVRVCVGGAGVSFNGSTRTGVTRVGVLVGTMVTGSAQLLTINTKPQSR